jgi:small-conductance mechanosensitive channel
MEKKSNNYLKYILWYTAIFLIVLFVISYYDLYLQVGELRESLKGLLPTMIGVVLLIVITKLILNVIKPVFTRAYERDKHTSAEVKMVWQLLSNLVWIFVVLLLILIVIGDFTAGLLTFGVVVAALLYTLQKPILNVAGWMDIIFHRPYSIGDRIEINGKKGYVVDVGMVHTTLSEFGNWMEGDTFTGRLITFPNSSIFEHPVLNYTKDTPYIWDEAKIAITYESDHEKAEEIILQSALEVVGEDMKKYSGFMANRMDIKEIKSQLIEEPMVRLDFAESAVVFHVVYFCEAHKRRDIRSDITKHILIKIKAVKDVHIAYPHMQVVGIDK